MVRASEPPLRLATHPRKPVHTAFSRDLLRAVADLVLTTTYDGVWLVDAEARTSFVNERMAALLGYTVDEMLGVPLFAYMDDAGAQLTRDNLERRRGGVEEQHEFKCIRKDGQPIWLLVTANPVFDKAGDYAGSLALIADLSSQKAREHALLATNAELESRIEVLTGAHPAPGALPYRDALTGLYNLRYLDDRLMHEVARCRRYSRRLCVLLVDVDGFGRINAGFGEAGGDTALQGIGRILAGKSDEAGPPLLRSSDVAARYGGDEFAVIACETELDGGKILGERILERLRARPMVAGEGKSMFLPVSVGVAAYPLHASAPTELIAAADRALFRAKDEGGGRVCVAEAPAREGPTTLPSG